MLQSFFMRLDIIFVVLLQLVLVANSLFVRELERPDGKIYVCQESNYFSRMASKKLSYYSKFFDLWSPEYIDNLTCNYEHPFYYNRIQIFDGTVNYERGDFWSGDYQRNRVYPEKYYADTLENILDLIHYLVNNYKKYIPNIDFIVLGSEIFYGWPTYFNIDYPIFRFETSNKNFSIFQWLLPTREYVQYWHVWRFQDFYKKLVTNDNKLNKNIFIPFRERIDFAVFRGSVYAPESIRYRMIKMLLLYQNESINYFDVKMQPFDEVANDALIWQNADKIILKEKDKLSDVQQMKYKFIIVAGLLFFVCVLPVLI